MLYSDFQPVILRCAALVALRKAIIVGAKSMSDQLTKDTLKALRAGLSEKAGAVVRESADVRQVQYPSVRIPAHL